MVDLKRLLEVIDAFEKVNILVVGDMMLDRFIWGKVTRISPEAPVPVVRVTKESAHLGGSANVVSNVIALGGQAVPVGVVGEDEQAQALRDLFKACGASNEGMVVDPEFATIQKTRVIAHNQQVCRVDREGDTMLSDSCQERVYSKVFELLPQVQAVIVSDYGKGVVDRALLSRLCGSSGALHVGVDPKDRNFDFYKGAHIITPNQAEAERMAQIEIGDEESLSEAAGRIFEKLGCRHLLITRGEHGMALFQQSGGKPRIIPSFVREVFDVSGAGDTVIGSYMLARSAGASPYEAAMLANTAAGVVVGKLGTATLNADELREAVLRLA